MSERLMRKHDFELLVITLNYMLNYCNWYLIVNLVKNDWKILQESKWFEELITAHMSTSYLITKEKTELFALYIICEDIHILLIVYHAKKCSRLRLISLFLVSFTWHQQFITCWCTQVLSTNLGQLFLLTIASSTHFKNK